MVQIQQRHLDGMYRRDSDDKSISLKLAIPLLVILSIISTLGTVYVYIKLRRTKSSKLPTYEDDDDHSMTYRSHRRNNKHENIIGYSPKSDFVYQEKQMLLATSDSPVINKSIPEIRITFPDDGDDKKSVRVVVAHVGNGTIGYGPCRDESTSTKFDSIDLDRSSMRG